MKQLLAVLSIIFFISCGSSRNYMEYKSDEKGLSEALKRLEKKPKDDNALDALPELYKIVRQQKLDKIATLKTVAELSRYDDILKQYSDLQSYYDRIVKNPNAFRSVTPVSYSAEILDVKQEGAEEFYKYGTEKMRNATISKDDARRAYSAFSLADKYVPGFKNSRAMAEEAYQFAVINVVVNRVQDNSFFYNNGWGNYGYDFTNEYFQQSLLRDLQNSAERRYAARFYSDMEARRSNVMPDWIIDLRLRNLYVPQPQSTTQNYNRSAEVQVGKDTTGKAITKTVYATLHVTRSYFTAYADFEVNIQDLVNRRTVTSRNLREDLDWSQEYGSYSGDGRALSSYDWQIVNNRYQGAPRKEDIMSEIYRDLYPRVRSEIERAVAW